MYRIDLATGNILTAAGKKSSKQIHFIEAQTQTLELTFINNGEFYELPADALITLAADTCEDRNHPMFLAQGSIADDLRTVTFEINTCTEEYCQRINSSNTPVLVDVNIQLPDETRSRRLVRFNAVADARVYVEGTQPVQLAEYYTKEQIDKLLGGNVSTAWRYPTVDHIYYHQDYAAVSYLDADNNLTALGYQVEPVSTMQIWLVSSDPAITGNVVLACNSSTQVFNVTAELQCFEWNITEFQPQILEITRQCDSAEDTLKDASGNIITALAVNWRVI